MSNTSNASGGIGLGGAVFIVFLVLKLTGHIGWSWWWVTSPLWMPAGFVLGVLLLTFLVALPVSLVADARKANWQRRK